jgi:CheY-like chemotaxis protein
MATRSEALPDTPKPSRPRRPTRVLRAVLGGQPPSDTPPARGRHEPTPRQSPVGRSLAGVRVLVVEDDVHSADYFAMALQTTGAVVTTVPGAVEALRALERECPDVVLSDIAMPGRDGYWLVRAIREHADAKVREVPVVATTAHGHEHSRTRALTAGFVDHLPKPVDPELLWAAIARAAGR